jgi:hypothetical protein
MFMFGAGNLYLTPSGTNPTPVRVGTLQDVSMDISFEQKELYGNKQFPVMVARGKGKITGKAKAGEFHGALIQSLLSGATKATGRKIGVVESDSVPGSSPFTVTVAQSAKFSMDLGVVDANTGVPFTCGATASAANTYAVAAGVYTFNTGDQGRAVQISYEYTDTAGSTILYSNQLMGAQLIYMLGLYNTEPDGSVVGIKFKSAIIPKLALGFKNDDFTMPDLDIAAFAAGDSTILEAYSPDP